MYNYVMYYMYVICITVTASALVLVLGIYMTTCTCIYRNILRFSTYMYMGGKNIT